MTKLRLHYLDAIRGIAVLMVLTLHSTELSDISGFPAIMSRFITSGKFGVQLFFVVSGFTLFFTLAQENKTKLNFYVRRFFRIAPAYYVAILAYSWYNNNWGVGPLLNFMFLHGFSPKYINSIVPGGWSIGIEMFFYLLVPYLFSYINDLPKAIYFLVFSFIIKTLAYYLLKLPILESLATDGSFIYFWFPNQLPAFAMGFVLFFILYRKTEFSTQLTSSLLIFFGMVLLSIVINFPLFSEHLLVALIFTLIIAVIARSNPIAWLENKLLLFIGRISYSAYLCQYMNIFLIKKIKFYNLIPSTVAGNTYLNFSLNLLILSAFTCIVAYCLFTCIEKPFQKLGMRIIHKHSVISAQSISTQHHVSKNY